jgi:uncharacterized SAM-binding protein YcdF (DUF218 family)|tara:strand:- start:725 stop:1387 length:663 start_codon:yes stop_codon:yes gene_type:complete
MPTIWLIILYFLVKSNKFKKFFFYLGFVFLFITSLPVVSTFIGKYFYNDNYRISNHHKKPAYVLVLGGGTYIDGYGKKYPTSESIKRSRYGKELSEQYSIPLIFSGGGDVFLSSTYFAKGTRQIYVIEFESANTFEMTKNLKKYINVYDGPLLLATDPMHHKRTILVLKKQNFDVLIPDNYLKNIVTNYSVVPSTKGIKSFNKIIYEVLGILWYYFTGKI